MAKAKATIDAKVTIDARELAELKTQLETIQKIADAMELAKENGGIFGTRLDKLEAQVAALMTWTENRDYFFKDPTNSRPQVSDHNKG